MKINQFEEESSPYHECCLSVVLIQGIVIMGDGSHVALHVDVAVLRVLVCHLTKIAWKLMNKEPLMRLNIKIV